MRLSTAGWAAIAGSLAVLAWSIPGLIITPDFSTDANATSERVMGVDMNGWHAVSGFLIAIPALLFARTRHAAAICAASAAGLLATAVWALFSTKVAGVFVFPNNEADAVLHVATASIFLVGAFSAVRPLRR